MKNKKLDIYSASQKKRLARPIFITHIPAGFPSPADDFIDKKLDLNEYLIKHPAATFFVKVNGDSMIRAGIDSGDILVVDRSIEPSHNKIIVAIINGEFTVKRLKKTADGLFLVPDNNDYPVIEITEDTDFEVWGVVTSVIHHVD